MNIDNYKNYLSDLIIILLDKLDEIEKEILTCSDEDKDYLKGQIMGYYDTLTTMRSQAQIFNIEISGLDKNFERYLTLG